MIDKALAIVAPHHCYNCQKAGAVLCDSCKYDIVDEANSACIVCGSVNQAGICSSCHTYYEKAWSIGAREGVLLKVIDDYKFERVKAFGADAAELLDSYLPDLPAGTVVVPVPTIASHIRQRGYDHTMLIAKAFAKRRKLSSKTLLGRTTATMQRGASRKERFEQAEAAFTIADSIDPDTPYLIVDDVVTTGATVQFAAKTLHDAGARTIWVAVLARQPLDKPS